MSDSSSKPVLKESKLSLAADQMWTKTNLFGVKKSEVKINFGGLGKEEKKSTENGTPKPSSFASGYVFGAKLSERVTNATIDEEKDAPKDASSIFKKISEKASASGLSWQNAAASEPTTAAASEEQSTERLKASADEFEKKSKSNTELHDAEPVITGEEDEKNLLHINCKFYVFDTEEKKWLERGPGNLRVNEKRDVTDDTVRLVGRTTGNQRVLINSQLFPETVIEKVTERRLKLSAKNPDVELPQLFLLQASEASIESMRQLLEKRLQRLKNARKRKAAGEKDSEVDAKKAIIPEDEDW